MHPYRPLYTWHDEPAEHHHELRGVAMLFGMLGVLRLLHVWAAGEAVTIEAALATMLLVGAAALFIHDRRHS